MDVSIVEQFRSVLRNFERELDIQNVNSCCCGVTTPQCHALMELSELKSVGLAELSRRLSVDKSTASRTIDNLVSKSLVRRKIPIENRRTTSLSLSPAGIEVSRQIHDSNNKYYMNVLSSIKEDDLNNFLRVFEVITRNMKDQNKIPS